MRQKRSNTAKEKERMTDFNPEVNASIGLFFLMRQCGIKTSSHLLKLTKLASIPKSERMKKKKRISQYVPQTNNAKVHNL